MAAEAGETTTSCMLITANVGSLFEDVDNLLSRWIAEFKKAIRQLQPKFLAIHFQEFGGKDYRIHMKHSTTFIRNILDSPELSEYDRGQIFTDEDYSAEEFFTALGSIYLIHKSLPPVYIYNFQKSTFHTISSRVRYSGNARDIAFLEKVKFPSEFFPEFKWSRKGFIRTRWCVNDRTFELINIHLFHDASNIIAMQKWPSKYSRSRQRALEYLLQRFPNDTSYFIFGDFNFRLDLQSLVQHLCGKADPQYLKKNNEIVKAVFEETGNNNKVILTLEKKVFEHENPTIFTESDGDWLRMFDKEMKQFSDKVLEFDIEFPPSYPFTEGISRGNTYMQTRCPAWCDRVCMDHGAIQLIDQSPDKKPVYNMMGRNECMGDHKPIYLFFHMLPKSGSTKDKEDRKGLTEHPKIYQETFV